METVSAIIWNSDLIDFLGLNERLVVSQFDLV